VLLQLLFHLQSTGGEWSRLDHAKRCPVSKTFFVARTRLGKYCSTACERAVGAERDRQRRARLRQEFITPYSPEQNGIVERFFRSLEEECVWQHSFPRLVEARRAVRRWIAWYNERRPYQALGYLSSRQYRRQRCRTWRAA